MLRHFPDDLSQDQRNNILFQLGVTLNTLAEWDFQSAASASELDTITTDAHSYNINIVEITANFTRGGVDYKSGDLIILLGSDPSEVGTLKWVFLRRASSGTSSSTPGSVSPTWTVVDSLSDINAIDTSTGGPHFASVITNHITDTSTDPDTTYVPGDVLVFASGSWRLLYGSFERQRFLRSVGWVDNVSNYLTLANISSSQRLAIGRVGTFFCKTRSKVSCRRRYLA